MDEDPPTGPKSSPPPIHRDKRPGSPPGSSDPFGGLGRYASAFSALPPVPEMGKGELPEGEEKIWAMLSHIGALLGLSFIAPLVVYLVFKDRSPFVEGQAKEALNFHLSYLIYSVVCILLGFLIIPIFIVMALGVLMLVVGIIAGVKAYEGTFVALPFTIRFLR